MTVIPALHSDVSLLLREQPIVWPPREMGPEREANLNPKIPNQHQDGPDPVVQNSFWQRMVNTPSIPGPLLNWANTYSNANTDCDSYAHTNGNAYTYSDA